MRQLYIESFWEKVTFQEVEVPDENIRQSPIGAETSDEELHANLDGVDDWEPWEDEEICASPNSIWFDEIFFIIYVWGKTMQAKIFLV